jgi:hypothetical protein
MIVLERGGRLLATVAPSAREHTWHPSVSRLVATAMDTVTADS